MLRANLPRLLAAGVAACLALGARPAAAQDEQPDSAPRPLWVSVGMLGGGSHLDGNASRGWERVGSPGPSLGGAVALGFDTRYVGAALGAEAAALKVGGRRGSSVALAATLRWRLPKTPASRWDPIVEVGYLRLGFGSARVSEAELPSGLFKNGVQGDWANDEDLSLRGNGIRMGVSVDRAWRPGMGLVLGVGADAVHFDAATYEGSPKSLSSPGWGIMPRLLLGMRISADPMTLLIGSGGTRR